VAGVKKTDRKWQEKSERELIWAGTTANFAFIIEGYEEGKARMGALRRKERKGGGRSKGGGRGGGNRLTYQGDHRRQRRRHESSSLS
jgi:hypothetical protein